MLELRIAVGKLKWVNRPDLEETAILPHYKGNLLLERNEGKTIWQMSYHISLLGPVRPIREPSMLVDWTTSATMVDSKIFYQIKK